MNDAFTPSAGDAKLVKHSLIVAGHRTSISLEGPFWRALREEAARRQMSVAALVSEVDETRAGANLSSALRVYLLQVAERRAQPPTDGGSA